MIRPADHWKNQLYEKDQEIERLSAEVSAANARERPAFMAGFQSGYEAGEPCTTIEQEDYEQAWQQYRCQDDSDWKVTDSTCQRRPVSEDVCGECGAGLGEDCADARQEMENCCTCLGESLDPQDHREDCGYRESADTQQCQHDKGHTRYNIMTGDLSCPDCGEKL